MKAFKENGEGVLLTVELNELQVGLPWGLEEVLAEFEGGFANSEGLPPTRNKDHAINLFPDTTPVIVRPYRYPYLKKMRSRRWCVRC